MCCWLFKLEAGGQLGGKFEGVAARTEVPTANEAKIRKEGARTVEKKRALDLNRFLSVFTCFNSGSPLFFRFLMVKLRALEASSRMFNAKESLTLSPFSIITCLLNLYNSVAHWREKADFSPFGG